MIIRFKSKKGYLLLILTLHSAALCLLPALLSGIPALFWIFGSTGLLLILLTIGLYSRTFYVLNTKEGKLNIYFLFRVKSIPLQNISEVMQSDVPMSGFRYALSYNDGLLLKVGKYDQYFINPEDSQAMIEAVKKYQAERD